MRCIIIEDELPAQRILKNYISKIDSLELVGSYQSAIAANVILKNESVDLIFLDINLPDISGMQYVKTLINPPKIIITTAYPEFAVESFEIGIINDYLVKPISFERFFKSINKVSPKNESKFKEKDTEYKSKSLFINVDKTLHNVIVDEICYITSDRNYITIVTEASKYTYIDSLKNWLEGLPTDNFIQVHKSFIINISKITKIAGNTLFINNHKIPIGRLYKEAILKKTRTN